ncbi:MAG: outer membrane beta-barrel protein [Bacteroidaceae bacterium]|nr:outer membrane beta-barrel protein [Bacteroidaceae bacterium]
MSGFKYRLSLLIAFTLVCSTPILADRTATIAGFAHDRLTHETLIGTKVSLMKGDSIINVSITNKDLTVGSKGGLWFFVITLDGTTDYTLLLEHEGYNVMSWPLKAQFEKKPLKTGEMRFLGDIPMDKAPKTHELDGVTITATKVKFYNKGDTLIYNADAFQTADGSMLDALIRQLPDAELNNNGEIFVNGRKVESLLLNGEKFFNGKNEIMLEYLPAYMVKTVKTYEKSGNLSLLTGRDMGDKEFVMDVSLRREHKVGWIGNVEGGYGSEERYLARLFAMRFTPQSRITLYGNLNNLNDNRKPGENSSWTPEQMPTGLMATKKVGADLFLKNKKGMSKYNGNIELSNIDTDDLTETTGETFLTDGSVFSRSRSLNRARDFSISNSNDIEIYNKTLTNIWVVKSRFNYVKSNSLNQSVAMAFNQNPANIATSALIDSVYRGSNPQLSSTVINRNINNTKLDGHKLDLELDYGSYLKLDGSHFLTLNQSLIYSDYATDTWKQMQIDYPNISGTADDVSNRYNHSKPDKKFSVNTNVQFNKQLTSKLSTNINYDLTYSRQHNDYNTYMLHQLTGWGDVSAHPIGMLPSEMEYAATFDRQNSFLQQMRTVAHTPSLMFIYNDISKLSIDTTAVGARKNVTFAFLMLPLTMAHDRLDYTRAAYSGLTRRNTVLFKPRFIFRKGWGGATGSLSDFDNEIEFEYSVDQTAPSMLHALNLRSDEDPLNIYYGNEHLHKTTTHNATLDYNHQNKERQTMHHLGVKYNISHNAVAMGYIYDKATGIRTYAPGNVSGNYTLEFEHSHSRPLDKQHHLTLDNKANWRITHGVDLVGTDTGAEPIPSSVMTHWVTDQLLLDYQLTKSIKLGAKGYMGYGHSSSGREDFSSVSLWDFNYGLTSLISLPWDMQLSTDITMYSRRGYANAGSNTNDLVWNARISKTIPKLGLTLALDGFDILGNLSNISQVLNSQGRTETYRNSLPRYVMLHAIYRLNLQPKKKSAASE